MSLILFFFVSNPHYHTLFRFHTDPSGTFMRYEAKAIGSGSEAAQSELQDRWHSVRDISSGGGNKSVDESPF